MLTKKLAFTLLAALWATAAFAQTEATSMAPPKITVPTAAELDAQARAESADFPVFTKSRPAEEKRRDVDLHLGSLVIQDGDTNYRLAWLPIMAPLPGSVPGTTHVLPTAFALLHTEFPYRKGLRPAPLPRE
jgi:hypothetical protein